LQWKIRKFKFESMWMACWLLPSLTMRTEYSIDMPVIGTSTARRLFPKCLHFVFQFFMLQVKVSLPFHTFLSSTVDTVERPVSGFCRFPAAPLMENRRSPLDGKLGGLHRQSEKSGERKTSSTCLVGDYTGCNIQIAACRMQYEDALSRHSCKI